MNNKKQTVSIGKNFIYNTAYQMLAMLIPLITTPYASRIFGANGIGVQSYTSSMAMVFSLFAALGVLAYGQREIAQHRDDKKAASKLFWEIELLCVMTTLITLGIWFLVSFFEKAYTPYFLFSSFTILAVAFDISWFFAGYEEFRFIVLRNAAVKLIGILLLFVFVRQENDLLLYIALLSATGLVGNITMWSYLPKFLAPVDWKELQILRHLRQTMVYFIPTIASSVYTMVDKAMLRFLTEGTSQNGYYEQTTKIVRMAQTILLSLNTVMSSRMSYLFSQGKLAELKQRLERSISFILLLAIPLTLGIVGISRNFVPWFFGEGFDPVVGLLCCYSPLLIFVGISNCLGTQYLTPSGQRGRSSKGIIAGAVINIILNFILIPSMGAMGATIASVIAEITIMLTYCYMSKEYICIAALWRHTYKRLIAGAVMLAAVLAVQLIPIDGPLLTILQIAVGCIVYACGLFVLRDELVPQLLKKVTGVLRKSN